MNILRIIFFIIVVILGKNNSLHILLQILTAWNFFHDFFQRAATAMIVGKFVGYVYEYYIYMLLLW